jgi:hypothetical protein
MPEHPDTGSLFAHCIALNREAFAAGYYNTAYHALAAALHVAHARQEAEGLARVERLAVEQLAVLDATAPAYEYSTRSAEASGLPSIFTMLAREAQAMLLRLPVVRGECRGKWEGLDSATSLWTVLMKWTRPLDSRVVAFEDGVY